MIQLLFCPHICKKLTVDKSFSKWGIFVLLCLIWGSSFILMKFGMYDNNKVQVLNAYQVGAIRILSAGIVLLPFAIKAFRRIPYSSLGLIVLSGLLGSFFPAFLFCLAETKIDSGLTGTINALTPIFTILAAVVIYKKKMPFNQWLGVIIGFAGCVLLFFSKQTEIYGNLGYAAYVILATIFYGLNSNIVRQHLMHIDSTDIASVGFVSLLIPSGLVLLFTGYFRLPITREPYLTATAAALLLGIVGTAFAFVLFYKLLKQAGPVFSSMVTYGIPFIALGWGFKYGEKINIYQVGALLVILGGVYLASLNFSRQSKTV